MKQIIEIESGYIITFDWNPRIMNDIKLIPGRSFDHIKKTWFVPKSSRDFLTRFAEKHGFNFQSETAKLFKNFDYSIAPMPDLKQEIPLKMELFPYQKQGVQYILEKKRLIVGDRPGLGKTGQAIAAILSARSFPCLIVCPSSLKINWQREVEKWTSKNALILDDRYKDTWPFMWETNMAQFFIVNYESLKKYFVTKINQPTDPKTGKKAPLRLNHIEFSNKVNLFKSVIVDESHRVKDIKTQQAKFVKGICTKKDYILLLTGTPVVNKPRDLVSQLGIIDRIGDMGGYQNFVKLFCEADNRWRELNVMLRNTCFYRREKTDVLKQLPAKVRQAVLCDISTRREYQAALDDLKDYLKRYKSATDEEIRRSMKGEIMVRIGILKNISARGKVTDVVDYVSDVVDAGEKIILFTHLREVQEMLKSFFPGAVTIFGGDDMQTRQRNVDAFQNDPQVQIIICSIKAAGVGITLTASSRVAFVELPWHPADCEQCEDRAHRIGQTDSVQCTYFLGKDTIDEDIYKLIAGKRDMSNQITGATSDVEENIMDGVINILSR